jgi:hypothetical protein
VPRTLADRQVSEIGQHRENNTKYIHRLTVDHFEAEFPSITVTGKNSFRAAKLATLTLIK